MPSKSLIAAVLALLGAAAALPASAAAAKACPPGVSDATYCEGGNPTNLVLLTHTARTANDKTFKIKLLCEAKKGCSGTLFLEGPKGVRYAKTNYSLKHEAHKKLTIHLKSEGREAVEETGKRKVTVAVVVNRTRSVIGKLTIEEFPPATGQFASARAASTHRA